MPKSSSSAVAGQGVDSSPPSALKDFLLANSSNSSARTAEECSATTSVVHILQRANARRTTMSQLMDEKWLSDIDVGLLDCAVMMRNGLMKKTKDRKYHLKVYRKCFLHKDALEWLAMQIESIDRNREIMQNSFNSDRNIIYWKAAAIGNRLIAEGYISHVCDDHFFSAETKDMLFFRFQERAIDHDFNRTAPMRPCAAEAEDQRRRLFSLPEYSGGF